MKPPRKEQRLGKAKNLQEAMQMIWLAEGYSPRVVKIIDCLISLEPLGPEHEPARTRYALRLAKEMAAATAGELCTLAEIKRNGSGDWKKCNVYGWPEVFEYAYRESIKIEAGQRPQPITLAELRKFLIASNKGYFTDTHIRNMVKALKPFVEIDAPRGRPKKRTK